MMLFSRRQAICAAGAALAAPLAAPYIARANIQISPFTNRAYSKRAIELVQRAVQFGVNNYLVKPFTVAQLKGKLEAVFGPLT